MDTFSLNIKNSYGKNGEKWIKRLPKLVKEISKKWNLVDITPVANMTFNFVMKAILNSKQPVVLKLSYDIASLQNERQALLHFQGEGAVKLLDYNDEYNALLLQQAIPGKSLKTLYTAQMDYVMDRYIATMYQLHKPLNYRHCFPHVKEWLLALDQTNSIPHSMQKNL